MKARLSYYPAHNHMCQPSSKVSISPFIPAHRGMAPLYIVCMYEINPADSQMSCCTGWGFRQIYPADNPISPYTGVASPSLPNSGMCFKKRNSALLAERLSNEVQFSLVGAEFNKASHRFRNVQNLLGPSKILLTILLSGHSSYYDSRMLTVLAALPSDVDRCPAQPCGSDWASCRNITLHVYCPDIWECLAFTHPVPCTGKNGGQTRPA